jgi:23S rRNA (pseudouridine1915-N3)-methyltransferase
VVLDLNGKEISSEQLADVIKERATTSDSKVTFVIGGSLGLGATIIKRADLLVRIGKITFPHQLMRVVLSEQIYRAMTIINNVKYHK